MATGLPDYYRGIDVTYQTLSELMNRPKYGAANVAYGELVVTASAETVIVTVNGKGMVYGGVVALDHTSTQSLGIPRLYVDGSIVADSALTFLNKYGLDVENSYGIYLRVFDETNFVYGAGFSRGITFETSIEVRYREVNGSTPSVAVLLVYALI